MDKNVIAIIVAVVLLGVGGFFLLSKPKADVKPVAIPEGILLFYGEGCPHCKVVEGFLNQNKISDKVKFSQLEVWYDKDNQNILSQVVLKCGIKTDQIGVPFLYDGSKCYSGQDDVINFFKSKAGIQ